MVLEVWIWNYTMSLFCARVRVFVRFACAWKYFQFSVGCKICLLGRRLIKSMLAYITVLGFNVTARSTYGRYGIHIDVVNLNYWESDAVFRIVIHAIHIKFIIGHLMTGIAWQRLCLGDNPSRFHASSSVISCPAADKQFIGMRAYRKIPR